MRMCPKCGHILDKDSYFGKWKCMNKDCNYSEPIKNSLFIEELNYDEYSGIRAVPSQESMMNKINEIIKTLNKITNSRLSSK